MIAAFEQQIPIFGVCLGHQSLVHHFGGNIVSAERLMHGKTSMVEHDGKTIYGSQSAVRGGPLSFAVRRS